jgi:ferredoxin-NADP reductase
MSYTVPITDIQQITHDVKQFTVEKPEGYEFEPGQATEVSINKEGWKDEKRPFTFTSLNEDPALQFTIKIYDDHNGVTKQIGKLQKGDEFIVDDPWGTIQYKGKGVFLAGGAGLTPFIAILRKLYKDGTLKGNRLIFSNKSEKDIILKDEFRTMLGPDFLNTLPEQDHSDEFHTDVIDKEFLEKHVDDFDQHFYVCGPPQMVDDIKSHLKELGADADGLVFEE